MNNQPDADPPTSISRDAPGSDERPVAGGDVNVPEAKPSAAGPTTFAGSFVTFSGLLEDGPPQGDLPALLPNIPGYEILAELGRGGMGVVYLGRDNRLNRLVAIKMLRGGVLSDEEQMMRFRVEAQAIAKLSHPGIVQIYEFGMADLRPYFVLEYVAGGSLRQRTGAKPQPPRWAAEMVAQLADAMDYAHQQGVIHRDLKTANVLLPETGKENQVLRTKITDFGLAKFENDALAGSTLAGAPTRPGEVVGTPNYMAPEQARGLKHLVTPLADIYSLGAILYELLTGRPPYEGPTAMETLLLLLNEDVLPPRKLQPAVPRDLETICLRALHREPQRRYSRAGDLAADLRRYLSGEPIRARPTSAWERGWKWARRRPAAAALMATSFLAVTALTGGGWYYNTLLANALQQARQAEEAAAKAAAQADLNAKATAQQEKLALESLSTMVYELQVAFQNIPETRKMRERLLQKALGGLDAIASGNQSRPRDLTRATAHGRLAEIYRTLGQDVRFVEQAEQALDIAAKLLALDPTDAKAAQLSHRLLLVIGEQELNRDRSAQAQPYFQRALQISEQLLTQDPSVPLYKGMFCTALEKYAHAFHWRHERSQAQEAFGRLSRFARQWYEDSPNSYEARRMLTTALNWEGVLAVEQGQFDCAEERFREAFDLTEVQLASAPNDRELRRFRVVLISNLQKIAEQRRQFKEAVRRAEQVESEFGKLVATDPDNVVLRCEHADSFFHLGVTYYLADQFDAALPYFQKCLNILEPLAASGKLDGLRVYGVERRAFARERLTECSDVLLIFRDLQAARLLLPRARLALALGRACRKTWNEQVPRPDWFEVLKNIQAATAEEQIAVFTGIAEMLQRPTYAPPRALIGVFGEDFLNEAANESLWRLRVAIRLGYRNKAYLLSPACTPLNRQAPVKRLIDTIPDP